MCQYRDSEIRLIAAKRAQDDKEHTVVYWWCSSCNAAETTLVERKVTSRQCKCKCWMQWSYEPFRYAKSSGS